MNAAHTRAEEGCESYQIGEDLETPNSVVIVERWASLEAQYNHVQSPEFAELMPSETSSRDHPRSRSSEALAAAGVSG